MRSPSQSRSLRRLPRHPPRPASLPGLRRVVTALLATLLALGAGGCGVSRMAANLPYGILDNDDPKLVGQALPSYIVTVDGLLQTWPDNPSLLRASASLYDAYATLVDVGPERAAKFSTQSLGVAFRAACRQSKRTCRLRGASFTEFEATVKNTDRDDLAWMYALGSAWTGYLQTHSGDMNAIAELPRAQLLFERVVALDPAYERGMPQLYLAVMNSLLPPALGGKMDVAKKYFEDAIVLSGGHNLYAKMLYARQYARLIYDRELHDRLLQEVLAADPHAHGWTLANVYAQEEARRLLASADDYF